MLMVKNKYKMMIQKYSNIRMHCDLINHHHHFCIHIYLHREKISKLKL
jgi:hypothetical protein